MTDFANRVVLVTGGANGMGEATARTFAKAGATADFDAHPIETNVREPAQVAALVDEIAKRWGRVDVLHNNATSLELTMSDKDVLRTVPQLLLDTLRGNVYSMYLVTRAVLPLMPAGELSLTGYGIPVDGGLSDSSPIAADYRDWPGSTIGSLTHLEAR